MRNAFRIVCTLGLCIGSIGAMLAQIQAPATALSESATVLGPLGVRVTAAQPSGVRVTEILPQSPTDQLSAGDIILEINAKPVASPDDALQALAAVEADGEVALRIQREGGAQADAIVVSMLPTPADPSTQHVTQYLGMILTEDKNGRVIVRDVNPESPAATAGIRAGDIVARIGDYKVSRLPKLVEYLEAHHANPSSSGKIDIDAYRGTEQIHFNLPIPNERSPSKMAAAQPASDATATVIFCMKVEPRGGAGLVVVDVMQGSPAHAAGIQPGDVIASIGDSRIVEPQQFAAAISSLERGQQASFGIVRNGQLQQVPVRMGPCEPSPQADAPRDFQTALQQLQVLRAQIGQLQQRVEVLSQVIHQMQSQQTAPAPSGSADDPSVPHAASRPSLSPEAR